MVRRALKRLIQSPRLYDVLQSLVGDRGLQQRLDPYVNSSTRAGWIVDIGGGTGLRQAGTCGRKYVCVDIDMRKLWRFRAKHRGGLAVAGDAIRCPLKTGTADVVVCSKLTHHLNDKELQAMFVEVGRLVKEGGTFVLADALPSNRWVARVLWHFDRGSHPRTADALKAALPSVFVLTRWDRFRGSVFHDFVLCVARRERAVPGGATRVPPRHLLRQPA